MKQEENFPHIFFFMLLVCFQMRNYVHMKYFAYIYFTDPNEIQNSASSGYAPEQVQLPRNKKKKLQMFL